MEEPRASAVAEAWSMIWVAKMVIFCSFSGVNRFVGVQTNAFRPCRSADTILDLMILSIIYLTLCLFSVKIVFVTNRNYVATIYY